MSPPENDPVSPMTKIGLIGCGMWGRNICRNAASLNVLAAVGDQDIERAKRFADDFEVEATSVEEMIAHSEIEGIMMATNPASHEELACAALAAGKHVYVEKPLAMSLDEAKRIRTAAQNAGKQVMVGHLIRYHAAFQELCRQVENGAIGHLRHIQANRLAMGRIRNTESVLLDLCPHDLSLILALTGALPSQVRAHGVSHITPGVVDILSTGLSFEGGVSAMMQTSWISPYKEHRLTVTGSSGALVFDDTKPWPEKLTLYQDNIQQSGALFMIERASPIALPVAESEPLKEEVAAFVEVCQTGSPAKTDIEEALLVQQVLEMMQNQLVDFNTA